MQAKNLVMRTSTFSRLLLFGAGSERTSVSMKRRAANLSVIALFLLSSGCHKHGRLRVLPLTHLAIGRSATLVAFEEGCQSGAAGSAQAAPTHIEIRNPIAAAWSVSDASIASVGDDGTVKGLKTGRVSIRAAWEGQEITTHVEVVGNLNVGWLPQLSAEKMRSSINEVKLSLSPDRTLRFRLAFDDSEDDITLDVKAPQQQLPGVSI